MILVCSFDSTHDEFQAWMPAEALCSMDATGDIFEIDPNWSLLGTSGNRPPPIDGYECAICGNEANIED